MLLPVTRQAVLEARRAAMARRRRTGRPLRRPPPQLQPDAIRRAYLGALLAVLGRARDLVRQRLVPELPHLVAQADAERMDSRARLDESTNDVNRIVDEISDDWFREMTNERLAALARSFGHRVSDFQRRQLAKQFKALLGIDVLQLEPWLGPKVEAFAGESVALIKSVAQRHFADLETKVVAGLRTGQRWEDLADLIEERYGVAESSAKLVARDQVGKLFGDLNRVRQQSLGVTSFVWRTMNDNRVRDEHELLDGKTFSWDDLPAEGQPGEAINCRCFADPIIDELAGEDEAGGPAP